MPESGEKKRLIIPGTHTTNSESPVIEPKVPGGYLRDGSLLVPKPPAPSGFVEHGPLVMPQKKAAPPPITTSGEDINALRREHAARQRAEWAEYGIRSQLFLGKDELKVSKFLDTVAQAIKARTGGDGPNVNGAAFEEISRNQQKFGMGGALAWMHGTIQNPRAYFDAFNDLFATFQGEFLNAPKLSDAFFALQFFSAKMGRQGESNDADVPAWDASLTEGSIRHLELLDRNSSAYASVKGILAMHHTKLGHDECVAIQRILETHNDTYTDLGFLIADRVHVAAATHKEKANLRQALLAATEPSELIRDIGRYAALAFSEAPQPYPTLKSRVGLEIELVTDAFNDKTDTLVQEQVERIANSHVGLVGDASQDPGALDAFEIRTRGSGVTLTPDLQHDLISLGVSISRNSSVLGVISVHENVDDDKASPYKKLGDNVFLFRKHKEREMDGLGRLEMATIAKPCPRLDTPWVSEMTVVLDQVAILDAFMGTSVADVDSFIEQKARQVTLERLLVGDEHVHPESLSAEFLITCAKKSGRVEFIPAILRLYARHALPETSLFLRAVKMHSPNAEERTKLPLHLPLLNHICQPEYPYRLAHHRLIAEHFETQFEEIKPLLYKPIENPNGFQTDPATTALRLMAPVALTPSVERFLKENPDTHKHFRRFQEAVARSLAPVSAERVDEILEWDIPRRLTCIILGQVSRLPLTDKIKEIILTSGFEAYMPVFALEPRPFQEIKSLIQEAYAIKDEFGRLNELITIAFFRHAIANPEAPEVMEFVDTFPDAVMYTEGDDMDSLEPVTLRDIARREIKKRLEPSADTPDSL